MKYLKTYNESLNIQRKIVDNIHKTIFDTKEKIDVCLLQISDDYETLFSMDFDHTMKSYEYSISIKNDQFETIPTFLDSLESCIYRIKNELDGDTEIKYLYEFTSISGKYHHLYAVHKGNNEYVDFIKNDLSTDLDRLKVALDKVLYRPEDKGFSLKKFFTSDNPLPNHLSIKLSIS